MFLEQSGSRPAHRIEPGIGLEIHEKVGHPAAGTRIGSRIPNFLRMIPSSTHHKKPPRKDENIRKGYLAGRYGAIPIRDDFETMIEQD